MSRLHLPHPHIADSFVGHLLAGAWDGLMRHGLTTDAYTTPEAQQSWAQYDPDGWMAEHGRKETNDA